MSPAGFWTSYHKDLILTKNGDQGPWGGNREIYLQSETTNYFTDIELIEFAKKNDWMLVDSISFSADNLINSNQIKLQIDDYSLYILKENILPKLKSNDKKVLIFKTTWLSIEPGNNRETFENGFAIIDSHGKELKIYHFWGE
ncbi:hypothetical protein [Kaistella sp.]|uniref:hypothetical protein n=1 Tax=Kaistella sp. TaxID=2782235 RepID=UPI003C3DF4AC